MKLQDHLLDARLQGLDAWSLDATRSRIDKAWRFERFGAAVAFFNAVAALAEAHDHHPEVWSCHTQLRVRLWTHDAGGLTDKDFALAKAIDRLALAGGSREA